MSLLLALSRAARDNGDQAFLAEMAKFDPSHNQNSLTGWYEIVNIWLRPGDMSPFNFVKISSTGATVENGEI